MQLKPSKKILFTPPFAILFGRIRIQKIINEKIEHNINESKRKDIDQLFYDGFGF